MAQINKQRMRETGTNNKEEYESQMNNEEK
jgi:hypothetical protein